MKRLTVGLIGLILCTALTSHAQEAPCTAPGYSDFDFWLGAWQVHSPDGQLQGTNDISKAEGGCLIIERWRSTAGTTGQSYNYFNPATRQWRQVWVSQGAIIDYQGALNASGAMALNGTITYQANGRQADFKGSWTPREDGTVLQSFFERDAATGEWTVWFTGVYTRKD